MQRVFILFLVIGIFSCKKKADVVNGYPLSGTNWNLHFRNSPIFSFYAQSALSFNSDSSVQNFRSSDTVSGKWKTKSNDVTINFNNGDIYTGTVITDDSLAGTLTASGNNGDWYAIRR